jgi:hypothetical protein
LRAIRTYSEITSDHTAPGSALTRFKERVRQLLNYDGERLYWAETRSRYRKRGDFAGHRHHSGHRFVKIDGQNWSARRICWLLYHDELPHRVGYYGEPDDLSISNLYRW